MTPEKYFNDCLEKTLDFFLDIGTRYETLSEPAKCIFSQHKDNGKGSGSISYTNRFEIWLKNSLKREAKNSLTLDNDTELDPGYNPSELCRNLVEKLKVIHRIKEFFDIEQRGESCMIKDKSVKYQEYEFAIPEFAGKQNRPPMQLELFKG